jgi:hypothetical protein
MPTPYDTTEDPDLLDVLRAALAAGLGKVRTAIPAKVVSYDPTTQTITAQVTVRSRYIDPDTKEVTTYRPAPIANVPVVFLAGGGYAITWPLTVGDPVLLAVCDRSIAEWKETGADDNAPAHPRRFDLTDAVAFVGGRPLGAGSVDANALVVTLPVGKSVKIGSNAAAIAVAKATQTDANFSALLSAITGAVIVPGDGGANFKATLLAALASAGYPTPTGSTRLRVDG